MFRKGLAFCLLCFLFGSVAAQPIPLWDGFDVKGGQRVTLEPFLAENNTQGLSVIVCPGGSYCWLDDKDESDAVARWLQGQGISAFVLRYRTIGFSAYFWHYRLLFPGRQYPDMITDAQRALQWVREHAEEYHIDPEKVGMMGFSAGGHLVMSAACFSIYDFLAQNGIETEVSLRPAFVVSGYPVVTMRAPYAHKRSRRALLGERNQNNTVMRDSLSLERHIPKDCPPTFLFNCIDDPVVDYHNSVMLDSALRANQVTHRYIQYQTGGHGFGVSETEGSEESRQWKNEFLKWIFEIKL